MAEEAMAVTADVMRDGLLRLQTALQECSTAFESHQADFDDTVHELQGASADIGEQLAALIQGMEEDIEELEQVETETLAAIDDFRTMLAENESAFDEAFNAMIQAAENIGQELDGLHALLAESLEELQEAYQVVAETVQESREVLTQGTQENVEAIGQLDTGGQQAIVGIDGGRELMESEFAGMVAGLANDHEALAVAALDELGHEAADIQTGAVKQALAATADGLGAVHDVFAESITGTGRSLVQNTRDAFARAGREADAQHPKIAQAYEPAHRSMDNVSNGLEKVGHSLNNAESESSRFASFSAQHADDHHKA